LSGEEATKENTEKTERGPSEEPESRPSEKQYSCSVCGATVVPEEYPTDRGLRYRCPKCGKFMKPLTPEEVKERREEEKGPLPPLQVLVLERVKELLVKELPTVYGIPTKDTTRTITAILDTLTSASVMDPWNLHSHIKDFAPNANDRHLESIIEKIFDQLQEEGYLPREEGYQPRYGERRERRREYQPRYAPQVTRQRPRRYDYGEDYSEYDDYEPSRTIGHQRFWMDRAEERRREEEHELRMKRLETEILKVTRETEGSVTKPREDQGEERRKEEEHELRMKKLDAEILKITRETEGKTEPPQDQAEERRRQEEHELNMKRLEAEILKITKETEGSRGPPPISYEEVREFIDAEGKLCDPEKAVSVRIKRVPVATESTEIKELREEMRNLEKTLKNQEISQLREEIKGLKQKPEESEEVKALREQLDGQRKSIEDLKGTIEAKDRQALLDKISGLESRVSDLAATGTGEWKSDEIRLIKGSISDVKDLLQTYLSGERPLDKAERILTGGPAGVKPPSEMAGEAEREGVIQELRKHGLVTKVVERVRG